MVKELTDQKFETATANGVTLTDFWAAWCGPCRMQSPVVEELDQELNGQVAISKVDVDQNAATAAAFGIMSIPTLVIKKDGAVVEKLVGLRTKQQLKATLAKYTPLEDN